MGINAVISPPIANKTLLELDSIDLNVLCRSYISNEIVLVFNLGTGRNGRVATGLRLAPVPAIGPITIQDLENWVVLPKSFQITLSNKE